MHQPSSLRQRLAAKLDARLPAVPCIGCGQPTRTPDYLCADCARTNHQTMARAHNRSDYRPERKEATDH